MYLDLNARVYLVRRLFFRRASQNVVSPGPNPKAPARLILTAHIDAARSGAVFAPGRARRFSRLAQSSPFPIGPFRILFWSLAVLVPLLGLRMAGADNDLLSVLQLLPTLVLLAGIFSLLEIRLSRVVAGANDNASGVATAISLAAELDADPPENLDVWVVLDGAGESLGEGMRAFVRAHRKEFDQRGTFFCDIDSVGAGDVRFITSAGSAVSYALDRRLVELAEAIATADAEGDKRFRATKLASGLGGDVVPPQLAGFRTIAITCTDETGYVANRHQRSDVPKNVSPAALDRAHGFALELIRRLDADLGRAESR
jgi:Peptidase family M28